ncbi:MAG: hypothetical protein U5S82_21115 [Gammaproteobacteria bacterium]|nr:hypothetical protein [Gammaproteobacteria bacterium]
MKVFPIDDPVRGEQLLAVEPAIERYPDADWRQRLEYFTGRALTHTALRLEQQSRAGHLATLGQAVSPGVVTGLEADAAQGGDGVVIEIAAGMGIAASGEMVHINRNRQLMLEDIRVYAPASLLAGEGDEGAYRLGDTLGELRAAGVALPQAMVLLLQPVAVEHFGQPDSSDPCDYDPTDEAFENWQWLDGCRLVLYTWDVRLGPLPVVGYWRRNRIAYAIFEYERTLSEGEYLPWLSVGVPIALIGLDNALAFEFMDRNAVVRRGGEARGDDLPITPGGNRFLWQARFEQFNEQLVGWLMNTPGLAPADIEAGAEFRYLPPAGVLPKEAVASRQQLQHFFPPAYAVRALAIPYEQLDLAMEESASLLPYDLNTPDHVEVLVPVPQRHYDPKLLVVEVIDPIFEQTIARYTTLRNHWLGRRLVVRNKASTLFQAIKGRPLLYPTDDPMAIDSLEQAAEFEQQLVKSGDSCRYFKGQTAPPSNWFQNGFDDADWAPGITRIGYGTPGLGTALADMPGTYVTVFFRHQFRLDSIEEAHRYTLSVTTSGGFYAWLNGRALSSANVTRPLHNAPATQSQELQERLYELGELKGRLLTGENVLAIQAHNSSLQEEAFSIGVELLDTEDRFGTREVIPGKLQPPFGHEQYQVETLAELRGYLDTTTPLSDGEVAQLDEIGLEAYIDLLQQKINKADDRVEFGFLRLRADMYRVRQSMLGNEVGTKLATSPALAEIAKGESAVATKIELSQFYQRIKQAPGTDGGDGGGGGTDVPVTPVPTGGGEATSAGVRHIDVASGNALVSGELSGADGFGGASMENAVLRDMALRNRNIGIAGVEGVELKAANLFRAESSSAALFNVATAREVGEQNPIVGMVQNFNHATVGERLEESNANVSYMAGVAVKGELLGELLDTDINIDDLSVPGVTSDGEPVSFAAMRADNSILDGVIRGNYDPVGRDDEAGYFDAGIKALENVVGVLRLIEGRVQAYRRAIARCKDTLAEIRGELNKADRRLKTIADELAEARHDVSVARALKFEEQARIDALNAKRDKLLATQVPFLLFRRPRTLDARLDAPLHYLNPDLSHQPLPLCDLSEVETPGAVAAMLEVVRDAPMKWFVAVNWILPQLSHLADLHVTLANAKQRATSSISIHPFMKTNFQVPDRLLQGLGAALTQSQQRVRIERKKTAQLDLAAFQRFGWQESIKRVPEVVSLGDLIDGSHGRMGASQRAAQEMETISKVVTCLYVRFSEIPAGIRLDWAERLSQFDRPVSLRNLYSLPRFFELDFSDRHDMQRLVDWLYGRVFSRYSEAQHMISDLIRIALLSASHAPVNQLIAGYIPAPIVVRPGSLVTVVADLTRVRVGMAVSMVSGGATLVRGRVADIAGGQVSAEVHTVLGESAQFESGARVQIGERLGMTF